VGHEQQRPRIVLEVAFEPFEGFDVEVVGGLVEKQQRGFAQQQLRQFDPHLPPAAELARGAAQVPLPESEPEENLLGPRLDAPALGVLDAMLDPPQFGKKAFDPRARFPGGAPRPDLR